MTDDDLFKDRKAFQNCIVSSISQFYNTMYFTPTTLLLWELHRHGHKNLLHDYCRRYIQPNMNIQRRKFLAKCIALNVIPKFLKFRVPNNGCFKVEAVRSFQKRLLKQELAKAQKEKTAIEQKLTECRVKNKQHIKYDVLRSVWFHVRMKSLD